MRVLSFLLLVLATQVPSAALGQCEYHGRAALSIETRAFPERLVVDGDVVVRPQREENVALVEARVGLGFEGTSGDVRYSLVARLETGHGLVSIGPAVQVNDVQMHNTGLRFDARLNHYLELRGLDAACDDMMLFTPPPAMESVFPRALGGDGTLWTPRTRGLRLHARPGSRGSYRLRTNYQGALTLERVEVRGEWFRMAWTDTYNRLGGWVRRSHVRPSPRTLHGMTGGGGQGTCARLRDGVGDHIYNGPARPRLGAFVRHEAGGEVWASIRAEEGFEVRHTNGEDWARIIVAPGVSEEGTCGELRHAWIRADEVTFPTPRRLSDAFAAQAARLAAQNAAPASE